MSGPLYLGKNYVASNYFGAGYFGGQAAATLAGTPNVAAAAAGSLSTGIPLAAAAAATVAASAQLVSIGGYFAANYLSIRYVARNYFARPPGSWAADSQISVVGAATLSSAIPLAGAAAGATSAVAALTNWATVTLAGPLYTGVGGILDPNFWLDSAPLVGTTLYYDATHILIHTNGEIVSNSNNCSAIVQFQDTNANWALGIIVFTPAMVAYPDIASSASGNLATLVTHRPNRIEIAIYKASSDGLYWGRYPQGNRPPYSAGASIGTTATGALTTKSKLAAAAAVVASASAALTTSSGTPAAVSFSWVPPTQNVDNSAIAPGEVTGYEVGVRSGGSPGSYPTIIPTDGPFTSADLLANIQPPLAAGTYFAAVRTAGPIPGAWSPESQFTV